MGKQHLDREIRRLRVRALADDRRLRRIGTPAIYETAITETSRSLLAYTADDESTPYSGIDNAQVGSVYAQSADIEALRVAVENLRALTENLSQVVNALLADLKTKGLVN